MSSRFLTTTIVQHKPAGQASAAAAFLSALHVDRKNEYSGWTGEGPPGAEKEKNPAVAKSNCTNKKMTTLSHPPVSVVRRLTGF